VTGSRRKLHDEDLHSLYSSPSIIMTKSRWMRWAWHEAHNVKMRNAYIVSPHFTKIYIMKFCSHELL
jgi:hypothetical protein